MKIKENFLPIPDAPNYEVNSQFLVRNKKTGRILKINHKGKVHFFDGGKEFCFLAKTLHRQAVAAVKGGNWVPVPSLGNRYEINIHGKLRNAKTKKLLKMWKGCYVVKSGGKTITISKAKLLWETHGVVPQRNPSAPLPVVAECNGQKMYFKTFSALAKFLAPKIFYCVGTLKTYLHKRIKTLAGWTFTYIAPPDLAAVSVKSKCIENDVGVGKCLICGRKFQRQFNGEKFCSDKCRAKNPLRRYLVNALVGRS